MYDKSTFTSRETLALVPQMRIWMWWWPCWTNGGRQIPALVNIMAIWLSICFAILPIFMGLCPSWRAGPLRCGTWSLRWPVFGRGLWMQHCLSTWLSWRVWKIHPWWMIFFIPIMTLMCFQLQIAINLWRHHGSMRGCRAQWLTTTTRKASSCLMSPSKHTGPATVQWRLLSWILASAGTIRARISWGIVAGSTSHAAREMMDLKASTSLLQSIVEACKWFLSSLRMAPDSSSQLSLYR